MTSFLDTTINRYKQLLVNFGYDKLDAGVFVIAGNECENTKAVLEETGATVKICNGEDIIEEAMGVIDSAEIPHCFFINLQAIDPEDRRDITAIQDILKVAAKKLMRTHLYIFVVDKNEIYDNLNLIKKDLKSVSRHHEIRKINFNDKEIYNFSSSFGADYQMLLIQPPFLDV